MSTETENHMCLRYEAIYNAVMGDRDAIEEVLKYYDAYITSLSTFRTIGEDGSIYEYIDYDAVQLLQKRLAEQIPKWKEICK